MPNQSYFKSMKEGGEMPVIIVSATRTWVVQIVILSPDVKTESSLEEDALVLRGLKEKPVLSSVRRE